MRITEFMVSRKDLKTVRSAAREVPGGPDKSTVRLRVDRFALTANNISYGAFGEAMHYWDFFPAAEAGWGIIPVWGFAEVEASACDGVVVGERFYGYWPMASHAILTPDRVTKSGFADCAPHRRALHEVYNRYQRCAGNPDYRVEDEAHVMLLWPLFATSFLIDDFLADNDFFGARTVVLSSASSKTAMGTAFCLSHHARGRPGLEVIGLTSAANRAFVERLGVYDRVLEYDALAALPEETAAVYVDMSGSARVRAALHEHFGYHLKYSCAVGGTHWESFGGASGLPGPRPVLFFAPAQIKKRNADWGEPELQARIGAAWKAFMQPVSGAAGHAPWVRAIETAGSAAVEKVYRDLLEGRVPPDEGHILSLAA
ncbi:MAG: DUF2855 family protein [Burkholderiales bacterium]